MNSAKNDCPWDFLGVLKKIIYKTVAKNCFDTNIKTILTRNPENLKV